MPATHDLFLSYCWADKASVAPLVAALEARGLRVWQDAKEVSDFASIQHAVTTGLAHARALLAWYSARYNESRACQWELTSAYLAGQAEGDPRRRVLVVNPEPANAHVHLPELFDQLHLSSAGVPDDPAAVTALAERIHAALDHAVPTEPMGGIRSLTPPRWLPHQATGSNRFVGRLREMWQLHGALQAGQAAMLTGSGGKPGLAQVRGAGGIGKSLLAEEYALRFGAAYPGGVFWLRAFGYTDSDRVISLDERNALRDSQLIDLAARLGLTIQGLTPPEVIGQLGRHLGHAGEPFLWVVDDLPPELGPEGLAPWLAPHSLGRTLVATRARRFNHVEFIELPQLDEDEALRLLARGHVLSQTDEPAAREICRELGHHALAIDVAAALVERRGYVAFLESLRREDRDALELAATGFSEALPNGHERSIAATLLSSIREISESARDVLRLASVLASAPIPRELVWRTIARSDTLDDDDAQDCCDPAIDQLVGASLADNAGTGAIALHTLVARTLYFRDQAPSRNNALRAAVIAVLNVELPRVADVREHLSLVTWTPHARELSLMPSNVAEATLTGWIARYDSERGQYRSAERGFHLQGEVLRRLLGAEHIDTLGAVSNQALALLEQGKLTAARLIQEEVLEVCRRMLGKENPQTLTAMSNLSGTLARQGHVEAARRLQEEALAVGQGMLGEEHPHTLTAMNNLAAMLRIQGDLGSAKRLQEDVLAVGLRVLGKEHPHTLNSMNNLAAMLGDQGDLSGTRRLFESVLEANRRVLGGQHPDTLVSTNNLAHALYRMGDLQSARGLQEEVLGQLRGVLGEDHPDTLTARFNLALTLRTQGDLFGARRMQEQALEALRRVLGCEHPEVLTAMAQLALTLSQQGDLTGAWDLQVCVLEVRRRILGESHTATLMAMNNLALTTWNQGNRMIALQLMEEVANKRVAILGSNHPDTVASQRALLQMREA
jgi:tetratricopeptide (TPR) repeat protein